MPRIHPYPPEFRTEAMHLAGNSEQLLPALAGDLVHSQRTWLGMWHNRDPRFPLASAAARYGSALWSVPRHGGKVPACG